MVKIRFNPVLGGLLLLVGALVIGTGIWQSDWLFIGSGGINLILGGLFTINSTLELEQGKLKVKNPLGMVRREYQIGHPRELVVEGNHIFLDQKGKRSRIAGVTRGMSNPSDWKMFDAFTTQARNKGPKGKKQPGSSQSNSG